VPDNVRLSAELDVVVAGQFRDGNVAAIKTR